MEPQDFVAMFEYLAASRERFLAKFRELGFDEVATDRGASWGSMLGVFIHTLDVEESWLHSPAKPAPGPGPDLEKHVIRHADGSWEIDPLSFRTLDALAAYHQSVSEKTRHILGDTSRQDLELELALGLGRGQLRSSLKDILLHAFADEVGHLGELNCMMWQIHKDPKWLGWLELHHSSVDAV